jgi:hypothetical protein
MLSKRWDRWNGFHEPLWELSSSGLDPQEVKARELAESWVRVQKQWQEAVYGVEEELLMEEARDIKKEVRRRGLTERVNALLRERKFEGELIS